MRTLRLRSCFSGGILVDVVAKIVSLSSSASLTDDERDRRRAWADFVRRARALDVSIAGHPSSLDAARADLDGTIFFVRDITRKGWIARDAKLLELAERAEHLLDGDDKAAMVEAAAQLMAVLQTLPLAKGEPPDPPLPPAVGAALPDPADD